MRTPANPFYERLNGLLDKRELDRHVENLCRRYSRGPYGRPNYTGHLPDVAIAYFRGIDSERGIAWRVVDSLSLRNFIGDVQYEQTWTIPWCRECVA